MTLRLRPYQLDTLERCRAAYRAGARRVILQLSTGGGKTICASVMCRNSTAIGLRVLYVVHRDSIIRQTAKALKAAGVTVADLRAGDAVKPILPGTVLLASAQTLARRDAPDFDFGVWDESHTFYKLQQKVQGDKRWILLTATPSLTSGEPLSAIADVIVQGPSDVLLTEAGHLVPIVAYLAETPDLHNVPKRRGDYEPGALQKAYQATRLVGKAGEAMAKHGRVDGRWLRTMVYCAGVAHSKQVCAELVALGCRAVHIDGETPADVRAVYYADLAAQRIDAICNYGVAIEGLDIPEIECIAAFRAMGSLPDFLQSIGRGRRPSAGKTHCVYIDAGGNCYRHGWPTAPRVWTLAGKARLVKIGGLSTCKACLAIYPTAPACPRCGAVPVVKPRRGPQTARGELVCMDQERFSKAELARQAKAARPPKGPTKAQIDAWGKEASRWCPARPVPAWAMADESLWRGLEKTRIVNGHSLGDGSQTHPGWTAVAWRRIKSR